MQLGGQIQHKAVKVQVNFNYYEVKVELQERYYRCWKTWMRYASLSLCTNTCCPGTYVMQPYPYTSLYHSTVQSQFSQIHERRICPLKQQMTNSLKGEESHLSILYLNLNDPSSISADTSTAHALSHTICSNPLLQKALHPHAPSSTYYVEGSCIYYSWFWIWLALWWDAPDMSIGQMPKM